MIINQGKLIKKEKLTNDVYLLKFKLDKKISFFPGQYIILKINNLPRAYSIASSIYKKTILDLIIKIIPQGLASEYFLNLPLNSYLNFYGPYGQFILRKNSKEKIFFATGTGITPFLSMINSYKNFSFYLYWGLKNLNDVFLIKKLKQLKKKNKNFNFKICLSQEKNQLLDKNFFDYGHIDNVFLKDFKNKDLNNFEFYISGNKNIVISIKDKLINQGIKNENIIIERF